jgi:HAD superfamily hydrolase (TIGR01549 family)
MEKIKALIFDLDGTLANTLPLCIEAFRKSVEPLAGRTISDAEIIATFGPSEEGTIMALAPDHYDKGIEDYLHYYKSMHYLCGEAFDGIPQLLGELKERNIRMAMVTGKGKYSTDISLQQFGLTRYFDIIETGSPSGPRKAEGIQMVLNFWNDIKKEEVIYVGDAPSDITASRNAGIAVVAAAWAETAEPEKLLPLQPDEVFYDVPGFATWVYARI